MSMMTFFHLPPATNAAAVGASSSATKLHLILHLLILFGTSVQLTYGYHRSPCNKASIRRQFQFSACYAPNLNPELSINAASFVMAHDAATGYLNSNAQHGKTNNHNGNSGESGGSSSGSSTNGADDMYSNEFNGVDNMNNADNYSSDNKATSSSSSSSSSSSRWNTIARMRLLSLYGKTQVGSVYTQLNDGARALDLRPKIYSNGTIGFHHGSLLDVPLYSITLGGLLEDAKRWCYDNPDELVLIFHSELVHEVGYDGLSSLVAVKMNDDDADVDNDDAADNEQDQYDYYYSGIAKLKEVYQKHGVPYHPCSKLSGLTVAEAMQLADLSTASSGGGGGRGYLLAVDRHDKYASFCGKANWAKDQLVTCHSRHFIEPADDQQQQQQQSQVSYIHCTDTKGSGISKLNALKSYVMQSTNNEATNGFYILGPPADTSYYPFNQIQGFWQVDTTSVQIGITHAASNLLDDNRRSEVNKQMVTLAYNGEFNAISVFALDNVALNGNAMFSVLRNTCGQSVVDMDASSSSSSQPCGQDLKIPDMNASHMLPFVWGIMVFVVYGVLVLTVSVMLFQAYRLRNNGPQDHRLVCNGHLV